MKRRAWVRPIKRKDKDLNDYDKRISCNHANKWRFFSSEGLTEQCTSCLKVIKVYREN